MEGASCINTTNECNPDTPHLPPSHADPRAVSRFSVPLIQKEMSCGALPRLLQPQFAFSIFAAIRITPTARGFGKKEVQVEIYRFFFTRLAGSRTRLLSLILCTGHSRGGFLPLFSSFVSTQNLDATPVLYFRSGTRLCFCPCSGLDRCYVQTTRVRLRISRTNSRFHLTFVVSHRNAVYKNPNAHIEDRIKDLIPRMTLEEKVAQLIQGDISGWMNMSDPLDNMLVHNRTGQSLVNGHTMRG